MAGLNGDWYEALKGEFSKEYYRKLFETVNHEYKTRLIFPPAQDIFNAFHLTPLKDWGRIRITTTGRRTDCVSRSKKAWRSRLLWSISIRNCMMIWAVRSRTTAV